MLTMMDALQVAASVQLHGLSAVDAIYCSPFIRAIQTAAPLAAALGQPIRVDRGFGKMPWAALPFFGHAFSLLIPTWRGVPIQGSIFTGPPTELAVGETVILPTRPLHPY